MACVGHLPGPDCWECPGRDRVGVLRAAHTPTRIPAMLPARRVKCAASSGYGRLRAGSTHGRLFPARAARRAFPAGCGLSEDGLYDGLAPGIDHLGPIWFSVSGPSVAPRWRSPGSRPAVRRTGMRARGSPSSSTCDGEPLPGHSPGLQGCSSMGTRRS